MHPIDIVFDKLPGPDSPRFIEVEQDGRSIQWGEWSERPDGCGILRVPAAPETAWLIEDADTSEWWTGIDGCEEFAAWTKDASKAVRFSRESDATRAFGFVRKADHPRTLRATEHQWVAP